jgi:N,N'-diacetylchitobiose transport system substrate-binding protein
MKVRLGAAAVLATVLALASATGGGARPASPDAKAGSNKITVWLMVDAQNGWPEAVAAANRAFRARHPDVEVDVQYQTWGEHQTKFDAALAGGNAPDVKELGNSETAKYMAAGVLANLTPNRRSFPNNRTWLKGLVDSVMYNGRLYGVPYYAGARAVIYRKDLFRQAGVPQRAPRSLAQFVANGRKLMKRFGRDRNFSALYFPGKNWYAAMSFVYDRGGAIARFRQGRWAGSLNSPQAIAGLASWKATALALSRASKTGDEANPQQSLVFSKGKVGSFIGNGWELPNVLDPKVGNPALAGKIGAFPMPSYRAGRYMPTFLGGSDLVIPVSSRQKALAMDWVRAFTGNTAQTTIARAGNIANSTTLARINANKPNLAPFAEAAKFSWFVPTAPNWANVESANVLQNMLVSILTGRSSIKAATTRANGQITQILNART